MTDEKSFRFTFFLPDARLLGDEEIARLPAEKRQAVQSSGKKGIWLELTCPDPSCRDEKGNITIPTAASDTGKEGLFLNLFCPDDSCRVDEPTDLP
jgi:hypothetical protein